MPFIAVSHQLAIKSYELQLGLYYINAGVKMLEVPTLWARTPLNYAESHRLVVARQSPTLHLAP